MFEENVSQFCKQTQNMFGFLHITNPIGMYDSSNESSERTE